MRFKLTIIILSCLLYGTHCFSQKYDDILDKITRKAAQKLENTQYTTAIYPFEYIKEYEKDLAEHIQSDFHSQLTSKEKGFKVIERETFDTYFQEHGLVEEGLINPKTAQKFGMLLSADAYVTGKVYFFGSQINIKVKVTHTETGRILAYQNTKLPIDRDLAVFLGKEDWFVQREEKDKFDKCLDNKIGEFCFENKTNYTCRIKISDRVPNSPLSTMYLNTSLDPGETDCFSNLKAGSYKYEVDRVANILSQNVKRGNFTIEKCRSNTKVLYESNNQSNSHNKTQNNKSSRNNNVPKKILDILINSTK